jgi:ribosomal protein S18 acetylase RimI-like enzyme
LSPQLKNVALNSLAKSDITAAHALYNRTFDWLREKGVRQWLLRLDEATFAKRQAAGEAFAIHVDGVFAGCVFVAHETIAYYGEAFKSAPRWWMHTLVIDRAFAGRSVGERAVVEVCAEVRARGGDALWLHCVNDVNYAEVIPSYYARLGFIETMRRDVTYPTTGNTFPMVVMHCQLPRQNKSS